ncbi:MAG: hypothetical protein ACI9IP_000016 [Arcticibacterium sp.]|jgi:hypothetical protein
MKRTIIHALIKVEEIWRSSFISQNIINDFQMIHSRL